MSKATKVAAHTPGPWRVADDAKLEASIWHHLPAVQGRNGAMIAGLAMNGAKGAANARLIASAPELLCTLRDLLDTLKHVPFVHDYAKDERVCATCRAMVAARAAIARVEGKPSKVQP